MATKQIDLKALLQNKIGKIEPDAGAQKAIQAAEQFIPKNLMFDAESTEFRPETRAVTASGARGLTVEEAKQFDDDMNRFVDTVLIAGVDYGVIPHCNKPTLLKSGAEKVANYLGLIARTEVVNRVEDYNTGFFSYECKVYLLDYNGVVKGVGIGLANTREGKYAKQNGFSIQNVVLKVSKKRAYTDGILNVGNLSARFTQDMEDLSIDLNPTTVDTSDGKGEESYGNPPAAGKSGKGSKTASAKQLKLLENLMEKHGSSVAAMNKYTREHYAVDDYHNLSPAQCSAIIDKFMSIG